MKGGDNIELKVSTLIFVLSLTLVTQIIALFVQYKVNKEYRGAGNWLLGSGFMTLGFIFMTTLNIKSLQILAMISNPLVILGHILFYIGIRQYLNKTINKTALFLIFVAFNLLYYYYMFVDNNISSRSLVISAAIAMFSFMTVYQLLIEKDDIMSYSKNFTASVFFIYGCFYVIRFFWIWTLPPIYGHEYQTNILILGFVSSILISNLWTFGLIFMINQRLNTENKLEKEKFKLIFNTNLDAQLMTRLEDGLIIDVNDRFSVLSGYTKDEVIGKCTEEISLWNNLADRNTFISDLKNKRTYENMEFVFQRKDGYTFPGTISARIISIHSIEHIIMVIRDITERKQFEIALIESEEMYRSILKASPDDITITDLEGQILMISPAAKAIFGYDIDFDDFIGMKLLDFIIPEDVERAKLNIIKMYEGVKQRPNEYRGLRQDKSIFDIEVNSGFVYSADGVPVRMVFIVRDISERKLIELQVQNLINQLEFEKNAAQLNSITDSLTGLANRRYLDEVLEREISRLTHSESKLSLIMLDIDYFKKFNDSYGHLAGDQCLKMIATALTTVAGRTPDVTARYGGEEFISILPETDEDGAAILGENIRRIVEELSIPHVASDISKYVTISVGIVTINHGQLSSPEQALKLVDGALYLAKDRGRNCCVSVKI